MTFFTVVKALGELQWHVWLFQSGCLLCSVFDEWITRQCADNVLEAQNIILHQGDTVVVVVQVSVYDNYIHMYIAEIHTCLNY